MCALICCLLWLILCKIGKNAIKIFSLWQEFLHILKCPFSEYCHYVLFIEAKYGQEPETFGNSQGCWELALDQRQDSWFPSPCLKSWPSSRDCLKDCALPYKSMWESDLLILTLISATAFFDLCKDLAFSFIKHRNPRTGFHYLPCDPPLRFFPPPNIP